ncbi:hypothetical protein GTS_31400 [Gandjariella thermophila]|uniref:Uncharacterized protein n=1 Tax=Gandjariella thermophila TaxID=1931992 RepID=A0A4D4JC69_9PSEU|nr:hypothetical protein GTS_31400 [Gandjariella thermophila]
MGSITRRDARGDRSTEPADGQGQRFQEFRQRCQLRAADRSHRHRCVASAMTHSASRGHTASVRASGVGGRSGAMSVPLTAVDLRPAPLVFGSTPWLWQLQLHQCSFRVAFVGPRRTREDVLHAC